MSRAPVRPDTRTELLAAARRVVRREGFSGATVGEITREAGASVGLLNYYFGSKDEALAQAFEEIARGELEELEEIARRPDPPAERLAAYLDSSDWGDRDSWMLWIDAWADAARVGALRRTLAHFARGWRSALAEVLEDGALRGAWDCPDPAESAAIVVAAIDGIGLQAMLHPGEVTPQRAAAWCRSVVEDQLRIELPAPAPPRGPGAALAAPPTAFEARIAVRARDLDAGGAVHPAAHLAYLEEAREGWLADRLGATRMLLARIAIDFRAPLRHDADAVVARCALRRTGRSSIVTDEAIAAGAGRLVVRAEATLVAVDAETRRPRALAPGEREALAR
ncbi:MAG TPA: TetR family transcriptional regulator C-terminal domain-containing protein [Solirubrobacteraceae bacterium]|nr:TetR family transcriptional regulator C-terminal domain-containing protein [Solirubrobacteraceae bacterium]